MPPRRPRAPRQSPQARTPLDDATAERLLRGAPADDLPDAYRRVGEVLSALSGPPTREELTGITTATATFITAHDASTRPARRARSIVVGAVAALVLVASAGTAMAVTNGALPEPVQEVAHEALGVVGISVPGIGADGHQPVGNNEVVTPPAAVEPATPDGAGTSVSSGSGTATAPGAQTGAVRPAVGGAGDPSSVDGDTGSSDPTDGNGTTGGDQTDGKVDPGKDAESPSKAHDDPEPPTTTTKPKPGKGK